MFSTIWYTQRFTELGREEKDLLDLLAIHGALKSLLHSEGHPERFTELHGEEKREEGVRGAPHEMRWNQKRREQASQ